MIEKLKFLKQKFDGDLYFSFIDNKMYILVDGGSDMLKPGITNSLRDYYAFEHIYKFFGTLFEFTSYISPEIEAVG